MVRTCLALVFLLLLSPILSRAQNGKATDTYYQTSDVQPLQVQFEADRGNLRRFYVIANAPERRERFRELYNNYLGQLRQLDFDRMNTSSQVDYILLKRTIDNELRLLDKEQNEYAAIENWLPFANELYSLEKQRRRGASMDGEKVARSFSSIVRQLKEQTQRLSSVKNMEPELSARAAASVRGLQAAAKSVYDFYYGYDPLFTWWVANPYESLNTSLTAYAAALEAKATRSTAAADDGSGIVGHPVGRDEILRLLKYDFIPYTPEELVNIANKEFAWCDSEMLRASREMGFGNDWKAALEKVKTTYVPPGKQPEMLLGLYNESVDFIKKNQLVTIPPLAEETWRMTMMSPQQQLTSPFFLGGETLLIAYPTNTMDEDAKMMSMRGNNPHFSRATVHHELIAGHGLQQFMNSRYKPYRNYSTPFWTEGWSLYWEFILYDMGFAKSPEDRIGMLFWRMHRCARIIFSLNYQLGNWTPQQCIDFLVDRVGHERANAEGEVRRSFTANYGPLYQLAYMTGAFQFWALKKELVDTKKMTYRQLNDAILKENNIPIELTRAILTNQKLSRDFSTGWRFYDK